MRENEWLNNKLSLIFLGVICVGGNSRRDLERLKRNLRAEGKPREDQPRPQS